ncbi:MAG TPA: carboxyl transferase domain-containing protein [Vicinamibacterales bacterium]|nr:carboxyl transferase domain-containing protein [Vicinamibacterales bacterium]HOQ61549.1 carboxyl transferase domain-containing protein [Vicinamibacterales bacterium]HPW20004.1 carboxyl transferase domain-containing protein [Vicinamibacterales bacterium]
MKTDLHELDARRAALQAGGGADKIARQHQLGKLSARERLALLFDADSFVEFGLWVRHRCRELEGRELPGDGVVTGKGEINGRPAFAFSQDFTVGGGALGSLHAAKIVECLRTALKCGIPVVGFNDGGGARIQEGVEALSGYGQVFYHNTLLSGVVPQVSIIAGPCAGGAAYSPALTDFIIMLEGTAHMFIAGPEVIKAATGESITEEALGGALAHAATAGNIHFIARDEQEAVGLVKALLSYLPLNNLESPPDTPFAEPVVDNAELDDLLPGDSRQAYDVREVIVRLVDADSFFEVQRDFAPNMVIGFARLGGVVVGVVANNPAFLAGAIDINAADKSSRFIRTCNVFNVPIVTLVDVPGFLPGVAQEHGGIIRHGAKMLFTYSASTVPKLTVILRKAYGGAYLAMCSRDMGADSVLAWPTAEIAVMGPEGAARVLYKKEIEQAADKAAAIARRVEEYRRQHANPFRAAEAFHLDDIIRPSWTRRLLIERLGILRAKRDIRPQKKHGNLPL